jgi:peptide/nickel transport system permease protein
MNLFPFLMRRLALSTLVVFGVMVITFIVSHVVPNDPARLYAGAKARPEQLEAVREQLRLNDPLPQQFVRYAGNLARGNLGESFKTRRAISEDLKTFFPATMELVLYATLLALVIGIPVGVLSASQRGKWLDSLSRIVTIAGVSIPSFWLAILLQLLFFSSLGWLPLSGRLSRDILLTQPIEPLTGFYSFDGILTGNWTAWKDALWHLILPVVVLATYPISLVSRMTRAAMIEVLDEPYIRTARAAGLPMHQVLFKRALKNALIPTLTVLGLTFAYSITGAVLVEIIFAWPGLGKYVTDAIIATDFPVIVSVTLIVTILYVVINLLVDLLQAVLDPRIELG